MYTDARPLEDRMQRLNLGPSGMRHSGQFRGDSFLGILLQSVEGEPARFRRSAKPITP